MDQLDGRPVGPMSLEDELEALEFLQAMNELLVEGHIRLEEDRDGTLRVYPTGRGPRSRIL